MMLTWIGYALLCATALAALGGGLEYGLTHQRYARRALWIGVMLASAGVPIVASLLAKPPVAQNHTVVADAATLSDATSSTPTRPPLNTDRVVQIAWAAASLAAALWLGILQFRLRRRLRRCGHTEIDGTPALVSPDLGPAVVGVFHPEIVLPEWALALDDADRRLVLAHETEHTRAYDPALHLAGLGVAVLFPWNAALWWQLKRLRLAIEIDCDARVVSRHGHDPIRYGELLVAAHTHTARPIVAALALVQRRSALGRRIDALVALPRRSAARILAAVGVGVGSVGAVAFSPAPSLREPMVVEAPRHIVKQVNAAPTFGPSPASDGPVVVATPTRPRSTDSRRRASTITQTLPPLQVTPNRVDAVLTAVTAPTAAALPAVRPGGFMSAGRGGRVGGAGGGAVLMAQPSNANAAFVRAPTDTIRAVATPSRPVRRDSTPPIR